MPFVPPRSQKTYANPSYPDDSRRKKEQKIKTNSMRQSDPNHNTSLDEFSMFCLTFNSEKNPTRRATNNQSAITV